MEFEILNELNIDIAINMQREIFPLENGSQDLKEALDNKCPEHQFLQKYWLVKIDNKYIGIFGLYAYNHSPKDAWLGWFGVVENERRKGYGRIILNKAKEMARDLGFETLRLYTDEDSNDNAVLLYRKLGMLEEVYENLDDVHFEVGKTLIFSISLSDRQVDLWNDKNLYLNSHEEKNK